MPKIDPAGVITMVAGTGEGRQDYLYKLPIRPRVRQFVQRLAGEGGWTEARQGWETGDAELQLPGWTRVRRCWSIEPGLHGSGGRPALVAFRLERRACGSRRRAR